MAADVLADGVSLAEPLAAADPTLGALGRDLLAVASAIAAEIRTAVRTEVGIRCSAGVAHNKLLSKLAAGLHKPDAQTSLPAAAAEAFVAPLPVRALRGVGYHTEARGGGKCQSPVIFCLRS